MLLSDCLRAIGVDCQHDWPITGLTQDSRMVQPGDCFCAVIGLHVDGRTYIDQAVDRGALVVLYDNADGFVCHYPKAFAVPDLGRHLSQLAAHFYNYPSDDLTVYAVTGTNGKSSVVHALAHALDHMGQRCWQLGTLGSGFSGQWQSTGMTTPGPIALQKALAQAVNCGAQAVAMEVSSHALDQGRVDGVSIDAAILTQISADHLDYHHTLEAYALAKARLFQRPLAVAVYNMDDKYGQSWSNVSQSARVVRYGLGDAVLNQWRWCIESADVLGMMLRVCTPDGKQLPLRLPLLGTFNVANIASATAALVGMGHDEASVLKLWTNLNALPGRMMPLQRHAGSPWVVVDYAHTEDALSRALLALQPLTRGRLWCVFGCGGNRDRSKRPLMLQAALRHADMVVVTCDNPRDEPPMTIIDDMMQGIQLDKNLVIELDRALAIAWAIQGADDNDIILIAGKGHETVQVIGKRMLPFSDIEIAKKQLQQRECS